MPSDESFRSRRQFGGLDRSVFYRGDKLIPAAWQSLNKHGPLCVVAECVPNIEHVPFQNPGMNMRIGPNGLKEFVRRHQPACVVHEISQNGKRLRL
jgi:hypothetical protein